jgi:hypothetical protein
LWGFWFPSNLLWLLLIDYLFSELYMKLYFSGNMTTSLFSQDFVWLLIFLRLAFIFKLPFSGVLCVHSGSQWLDRSHSQAPWLRLLSSAKWACTWMGGTLIDEVISRLLHPWPFAETFHALSGSFPAQYVWLAWTSWVSPMHKWQHPKPAPTMKSSG